MEQINNPNEISWTRYSSEISEAMIVIFEATNIKSETAAVVSNVTPKIQFLIKY
jgi:hypothetical protein